MARHFLVNNTSADLHAIDGMYEAIVEATKKEGTLPEELEDLLLLTRCPEGSGAEWRLDWK